MISVSISAALYVASNSRLCADPRRADFYRTVSVGILWIAILAVFASLAVVFQYLTITLSLPDIAPILVMADSRLGVDWLSLYQWVRSKPWLDAILSSAYQSGFVQLALIPFILIVTGNVHDYAEFVLQFVVASVLVMVIATPFPAESAYVYYAIHDPGTSATVSDFALFRSGHMRVLTLQSMQGLVSFPSFHTVLAVLFAYSVRHVKVIFPTFIGINALMILSTPTHGGHYIWDVLAGVVVALSAIWISRKLLAAFGGDLRIKPPCKSTPTALPSCHH